jgi:serine/threonine protein kinase
MGSATRTIAGVQRGPDAESSGEYTLCILSTQVFLTPQYMGIAMEFAPGGDMFEYVVKKNGLREDEARWFFQQLIVGLDYCHKMVR